jgi:hypothetical protein
VSLTRARSTSPTRSPLHPEVGAHSSTDHAEPRHLSRVGVRALEAGALLLLVAILYLSARHAFSGDSDGATVVLQGQAMSAGNVTLHGWALSLDSFWTIDAIVYTLVELVTGVRGILLYLVPTMIAAAVIVVGVVLARDGRRGIPGVAAVTTVVVILGLPSHALANVFLRGPLHVGTALLCLCAFAGLRSGRFGWGWVAAIVCLAAGLLGDFQTAVIGVGSVCAASIIAMLRTRDWRAGMPEVGAAVGSLFRAALIRAATDIVGTFTVNTGHPRASGSQIVTNLHNLPSWSANLLGVGAGQLGDGGVPGALEAVHVVSLCVVVGGIVAAFASVVSGVRHGPTPPESATAGWRLDDLLVFAVFADIVVFLGLTTSDDPGFLRYLTAAVIFGTVLAGRWVGRLTASMSPSQILRRGAAVAAFAIVAALAAAFAFTLAAPTPKQPFAQLGQFLESRQLDVGIGDYWSASITTVATDGVVTVRPVISDASRRVVRYQRQSANNWYTDKRFQFLVYDTARPWGGVDEKTATSTFGPAARTYVVGSYRVLVWRHPVSVPGTG